MKHAPIASLIEAQGLPSDFQRSVEQWYMPLLREIVACKGEGPMVLGVQGAQGSGKSTLAQFIKLLAEHEFQLKAVELSLDDFYLTLAEREQLSKDVHPLFVTRGVPGTHDVQLAVDTIQALKCASSDSKVAIPRFNKAIDDRFDEKDWDCVEGSVDLIIFEGWCVGCEAEEQVALDKPANELEAKEDESCGWRKHVNSALDSDYKTLFSLLDRLVVLQAPSFDCVYEWRWLQEQKLVEKWQLENPGAEARLLDENSVKRFISHYERLTRHCLQSLPAKADWVLSLAADHSLTGLKINAS